MRTNDLKCHSLLAEKNSEYSAEIKCWFLAGLMVFYVVVAPFDVAFFADFAKYFVRTIEPQTQNSEGGKKTWRRGLEFGGGLEPSENESTC